MKIKIYRYVGGYGDGWAFDTDQYPQYYRNSDEWKFIGEYDLEQSLIDEFPCYIE